MFKALFLLLALQANPNVVWKSEIKNADGVNSIVLTGELRSGIDHVSGTVDITPCEGTACYTPEYYEFDH